MRIVLMLVVGMLLSAPSVAEPPLPGLAEAFGTPRPGAGAVVRGDTLFRIDIPTQRYPDARCADGSEVPLYVRAASDPRHRDDWIVYLQGGGSCDSGQDCFERWKGRDGNFGANKLSSRFAPAGGIRAGGIFSTGARNPFAGWNQVFVYYCSSDGWSGEVSDRETSARVGDGAVEVSYRLHFLGARIVDATFDLLAGGAGTPRYRDADGRTVSLPDLDTARTVLFAGSSAGGGGVIRNVDRIRDWLTRRSDDCGVSAGFCAPRVAAVVDASYGLSHEPLDHAGSAACGAEPVETCTYERSITRRWESVVRGFWSGRTDASCLAMQTDRGDPWRCADGNYIVEQHLTTPLFLRTDLQDSLVLRNTLEAGFGHDGHPLLELQLLTLAAGGDRLESWPREVGVFAPQCGTHVGLDSNAASFSHVVVDNGRPHTLLGTLARWLRGEHAVAITRFDPQGKPAACR